MSETYLLPVSFTPVVRGETPIFTLPQDPTSRGDQPAAGGGGGADTGGQGNVQVPGGPDAPPKGQPQGPCADSSMLYMLPVFLLLMYFMMIRPEQKRRKEQQALLSSIKVGDKVVLLSGMHGVVHNLTERTVVLRVDSVNMTFDRSAVARIERDETGQEPTK